MKTTISKITAAAAFESFFVYEGSESFPLCNLVDAPEVAVDLIDDGWQGKDMDGFCVWRVTAAGTYDNDDFTIVGTFRNEERYKDFLSKI